MKLPFFFVFPPFAFGADVQKISTQSVDVYYGKITVKPTLTGDCIFAYFFLSHIEVDIYFFHGKSFSRVLKILSQ